MPGSHRGLILISTCPASIVFAGLLDSLPPRLSSSDTMMRKLSMICFYIEASKKQKQHHQIVLYKEWSYCTQNDGSIIIGFAQFILPRGSNGAATNCLVKVMPSLVQTRKCRSGGMRFLFLRQYIKMSTWWSGEVLHGVDICLEKVYSRDMLQERCAKTCIWFKENNYVVVILTQIVFSHLSSDDLLIIEF